MRVSEVSTLCLKQIDWDMKTILVHGKGKKDRYVMFDGHTQKALLNYLEKARPKLLKDNSEQHVFLSHLGRPLSTRGIQYVMQKKLLIRLELVVKYIHMSCDIHLLLR